MQRYMILYQSCQERQWKSEKWGISSAGRALHWQCRGQRFDPAMLHHNKQIRTLCRLAMGSDFYFPKHQQRPKGRDFFLFSLLLKKPKSSAFKPASYKAQFHLKRMRALRNSYNKKGRISCALFELSGMTISPLKFQTDVPPAFWSSRTLRFLFIIQTSASGIANRKSITSNIIEIPG